MTQPRSLVQNTVSNTIYFVLLGVVSAVVFPIVLRAVGRDDYGLFAFLTGFLLITQIISSSIRLILSKYVAELVGSDLVHLRRVVRYFYLLALIISGTTTLVVLSLTLVDPASLNVPAAKTDAFRILTTVIAASALVNGFFEIPRGILAGVERFGLRNAIDVMSILGMIIGAGVAAWTESGIVGFAVATEGSRAVAGLMCLIATFRLVPGLLHVPTVQARGLKEVWVTNLRQVINQGADILFYVTDRFILQTVRGPSSVGSYSVIEKPNLLAQDIVALPLSALVPRAARAQALNDQSYLDDLCFIGTRLYLVLTLPPLVTLTVLMDHVLGIWLGPQFVNLTGPAQLFVLTSIVSAPFKVYSHLMVSKGRIREISNVKLAYAFINVGTSLLLARWIGLMGVVIPTAFFWFFVYPAVWLRVMSNESVDLQRFGRSILMPLVASTIGAAAAYLIGAFARPGDLVSLLLTGVIAILSVYLISMGTLGKDARGLLGSIWKGGRERRRSVV